MSVQEIFKTLINAATAELEKVQQGGAAFLSRGDTVSARKAIDQAEKIQALIRSLKMLAEQWEAMIPSVGDQGVAEPATGWERTPPGILTPRARYRLPILRALVEMGGSGQTARVLDRVGQIMVNVLNETDLIVPPHRNEPRWRNRAQWERNTMVNEGLLSNRSPRGIWEITEKGREYLRAR